MKEPETKQEDHPTIQQEPTKAKHNPKNRTVNDRPNLNITHGPFILFDDNYLNIKQYSN